MIFIDAISRYFYNDFNKDSIILMLLFDLPIAIFGFLTYITCLYISAKIFGIFKILEKYNIYIQILFVIIISVTMYYFLYITSPMPQDVGPEYTFEVHVHDSTHQARAFYIIWLIYKFFNFLTKKFPEPFEKIGYYCSIEFYKDRIKKIIKR